MPRPSLVALAALVAVLVLGGCGGSGGDDTAETTAPENVAPSKSREAGAPDARKNDSSEGSPPAKSSYPMPRDGHPDSTRSGGAGTETGQSGTGSGRRSQEQKEKHRQQQQGVEDQQRTDPPDPGAPSDAPPSDPPDPPNPDADQGRSDSPS